MGIARSTFYDRPDTGADDATVVAQMKVDLRRVRNLWLSACWR